MTRVGLREDRILRGLVEPAECSREEVWALALDPLEGGDEFEAVAFVDPAVALVERVAQHVAELLSGEAGLDETVADLLDVDVPEIDRLMAEAQRHDLNLHAGDVTPSGSS